MTYTDPPGADFGPTFGLEGVELALWRCYQLTGEDVSEGPYKGWHADAVHEVAQMRSDHDNADQLVDEIHTLVTTGPADEPSPSVRSLLYAMEQAALDQANALVRERS